MTKREPRFPGRQSQGDTDKGRYFPRDSHRETRKEKRPLETESQGMGWTRRDKESHKAKRKHPEWVREKRTEGTRRPRR